METRELEAEELEHEALRFVTTNQEEDPTGLGRVHRLDRALSSSNLHIFAAQITERDPTYSGVWIRLGLSQPIRRSQPQDHVTRKPPCARFNWLLF